MTNFNWWLFMEGNTRTVFFTGIIYVSAEEKYQLESHTESTFITMDGEVIDSQMNRQEQMYLKVLWH